jgi:hypothetical protein
LEPGEHRLYNLEVEQEHQFYVGEGGVLVHNSYPTQKECAFAEEAESSTSQGHTIFGELDEFGRPTGVRAVITEDMIGTGSPAAQRIRPPGFGGGAVGHARGHLLGDQLGGSGQIPATS